jgi:hypothetical protein
MRCCQFWQMLERIVGHDRLTSGKAFAERLSDEQPPNPTFKSE